MKTASPAFAQVSVPSKVRALLGGEFEVQLDNNVPVTVNMYFKADNSALSESYINECASKGVFVSNLSLKNLL